MTSHLMKQRILKHLFPEHLEIWALAEFFEYDKGNILVKAGYMDVYDVLMRHKGTIRDIVQIYDPSIDQIKVEWNIND